jgi:TP901 family phage tail tape measure protein
VAKAGDAYIDIHGNFAPLNKAMAALPTTRVGRRMQSVGKSLTKGLTLPLVGVGVAAVSLSRDFGGAMRLISTQAGATHKEMEHMKTAVLDLVESGAVKQTPKELADALFHIESVGMRGTKALNTLKASADLSAVGQADMEKTTYALVSALETGIKGTENLGKTIGTLNAIVGSGDMKMEDLTSALSSGVLIAAKQVGLSLQDVGSALDLLTARGMPATQAATRLRMTFTLMAAPTEKAKSALKSIGLDSEALAKQMQKPEGLVKAIRLLKEHLVGLTKIEQTSLLAEAFGGARSGTTIMGLVQNLGDLEERFDAVGRTSGNFKEKLKEVKEAAGFKMDVAWAKLEAALIKLGDAILPEIVPAMSGLANTISKLGTSFSKLPDSTKKFIVQAGMMLAALGPMLWIGGKLLVTYSRLRIALLGTAEAMGAVGMASAATTWLTEFSAATKAFGVREAFRTWAPAWMSSLAKGLAIGAAAYGIGNIIFSATKGDWRDAGFEAGGAIAGGIAGFLIGGPLGAMIGVGLGSFGGELGSKLFGALFDSGKDLSPLQKELARTSEQLAAAMKNQRGAGQNLVRANERLNSAQKKQAETNHAVKRATDQLAAARKRYGRNSDQAARAEARLRNQKALSAAADRRLEHAERQHGVVRKSTIRLDRAAIQATKESAVAIQHKQAHIMHLLRIEQKQPPSKERLESERKLTKRLNDTSKQLTSTKEKEARVIKEAAQQIGPKFARALERMSANELKIVQSGQTVKRYYKELGERVFGFSRKSVQGTAHARTGYEKLKGAMGPFRSESHNKLVQAAGDVKAWQQTTVGGVGRVRTTFNTFASELGISPEDFSLGGGGKQRGGSLGRQKGGFTVPGNAVGDVFHTALPIGSFVMNKKATAAYGLQRGGAMPVSLEPKERVFLPHEVQQIGPSKLHAMNRAVPRFAEGGSIAGPTPKGMGKWQAPVIVGPDPMRSLGQRAVNEAFSAAVKLIRRLGGHRSYRAVMKEANRIDALHLPYVWGGGHQSSPAPPGGPFDCSGAVSALLQGSGFKIPTMTSSGFEGFGLPGQGKVSVLANPEHVYAVIGNRAWGTSGENPGGGAGWIDGYTYRGGFTTRHADIIDAGSMAFGKKGRGQAAKKGFAKGGFIKKLVGASTYGGPADHVSGTVGAAGVSLPGKMAFAELDMGKALGGLPMKFKLLISRGGKSVVGEKLDIGAGGGDVGGHHRAIDLWYETAEALGLPNAWLGTVQVGPADGSGTKEEKVPAAVHGKYPSIKPVGKPSGGLEAKPVQRKYEAKTAELKFGALPKSEDGCLKELHQLENVLLPEYRNAAKQHKGEKETVAALNKNIRLIEARIREVRKQLRSLRIDKAKKRLTKRLRKAMARITGWEEAIELAQRAYESASQYAEQVVGQEPAETGEITKDWVKNVFEPYIEQQERPAFTEVLGREAGWRNTIIRGQENVGKQEFRWQGNINTLAKQIDDTHDEIDKDNRRIAKLRELIRDHPKADKRPAWENERDKLVNALPGLHQHLGAMRGRRKQFVETLDEAKTSWDPWKGSGSFEDSMTQVQGLHWPAQHEIIASLPAVPVPGNFGGAIWDTQSTIQELGLKITQAMESTEGGQDGDESEKAALLEQLWREERERLAISQAQYKVFEGFSPIPNFGGSFATGGIVPGYKGEPKLTVTHGHEGVFTPEQMAAMGVVRGERPQVLVHGDIVSAHPDPVELLIGDKRFPAAVKKVQGKGERSTSRTVGRGVPGRAGVFSGGR